MQIEPKARMFEAQSEVSPSQDPLEHRYFQLLDSVADLIRKSGSDVLTTRPGREPRFLSLPLEKKQNAVNALEHLERISLAAIDGGVELRDNSQFAWWVIRDLGLRPLSDVFTHIKPTDVIEIYGMDHIQLFRSFNLFQCISYSLDELLGYEWSELYIRDEEVTHYMINMLAALFASKNPQTILHYTSPHAIQERFSPRRKGFMIDSVLVSPLFRADGTLGGYINVIRVLSELKGHA